MSQIIDNLNDLAQFFGAQTETIVNQCQRKFKAIHRQNEWLTIRAMLCQVLGVNASIGYLPSGKPILERVGENTDDKPLNISISHSKTHCALLLSSEQNIGVDIECQSPRILKIGNRFVKTQELPDDFDLFNEEQKISYLTKVWTVKEAVYKSIDNQEGFDLLLDIEVEPFDINEIHSVIKANIKGYQPQRVCCQSFENNIISTVVW